MQAIRVPSMGFLDQLDHWCLVVFLEKLPADPRAWIQGVEPGAVVHVTLEPRCCRHAHTAPLPLTTAPGVRASSRRSSRSDHPAT